MDFFFLLLLLPSVLNVLSVLSIHELANVHIVTQIFSQFW